jgi:hypothetical protein
LKYFLIELDIARSGGIISKLSTQHQTGNCLALIPKYLNKNDKLIVLSTLLIKNSKNYEITKFNRFGH